MPGLTCVCESGDISHFNEEEKRTCEEISRKDTGLKTFSTSLAFALRGRLNNVFMGEKISSQVQCRSAILRLSLAMTPLQLCRSRFTYSPATGELKAANGTDVIQVERKTGRQSVDFFGRKKPATHVIWFYVFGVFPKKGMMIDHIDRNPANNKLNNLRLVSAGDNAVNNSRSGLRHLFIGNVNSDGESVFVGYFKTEKERDAAVARAEKALLEIKLV